MARADAAFRNLTTIKNFTVTALNSIGGPISLITIVHQLLSTTEGEGRFLAGIS